MLRRLLACLVALAIALPSVGVGAAGLVASQAAAAECDCPPGKKDCSDSAAACDCGLVCIVRVAFAEPATATVPTPILSAHFADVTPVMRSAQPGGAPSDTLYRPPR